jgi:hydroxyacylglutathione hydrolase
MTIVEAIPILRDNYVWAIHDGQSAALVDPGESAPILTWLARRGITLVAILVTHHHADHVGGIPELLSRYPVPVFGPTRGASPSRPVVDGETLELPALGWRLTVMNTPGHTLDHVCYVGHGHLFCGDTLFSCGCGRLFEGTPAEMHASLSRLASLPGETQVHCAHEYTLANIAFALEIEPDNPALQTRRDAALKLRKAGKPTLPVSLATERETNPFLRCDRENLRVAASRHTGHPVDAGVQTFGAIRAWKDEP